MVLQRYVLVLAGLLIIALGIIVVPVSGGYHTHGSGETGVLTIASDSDAVDPDMAASLEDFMPEPAAFDTISPADSLQAAIDAAADGDTIYLDPGIYHEHGITISKDITIMANESSGGDRGNTIIDAQELGRIFSVTGPYTVLIENLTLKNGTVTGDGGAIHAPSGANLILISSAFSGCSADQGSGGAVHSVGGVVYVVSSVFSHCRVTDPLNIEDHSGGAIYADGTILLIADSTFSSCSATDTYGGAVEAYSDMFLVSSTFENCSAIDGGAIDIYHAALIISSEFSHCTGTANGGALWIMGTEDVQILSTRFSDCSATQGGAVYDRLDVSSIEIFDSTFSSCHATSGGGAIFGTDSALLLDSSTVTGCSAGGSGGAIYNGGTISITNSVITGCLATDGGAINNHGTGTITSSTLTGCSATNYGGAISSSGPLTVTSSTFTGNAASGGAGSAIYSTGSGSSVHFSRFYQNLYPVWDVVHSPTSLEAQDNWWGTNNNPNVQTGGYVNEETWLVLTITGDRRTRITHTASIRTNLTNNSAGADTTSGGIFVPDGITNTFAVPGKTGSVSPVADGTRNGTAGTTYTPDKAGTWTVSATVDGQTVYFDVDVEPLFYPTVDTRSSDSDPQPTVNPTAGIPADAVPLMTVTVNIGGDSKAWQAIMTGTKLSDLIVTGTVQSGPGTNQTAPPGIVYQYISLVPARYNTITKAVIHFTVPQSWLDENHIAPKSIVLFHQTANGWEALPTTVLYTKDGTVYFSAESAGFSLFAIAGTPTVLTPPEVTASLVIANPAVPESAPAPASFVETPVTTQTTAPPAATPQPAAPSPLLNIVLIIAAIGILAGGGFMVRRWWIQRQNPALFREYD
jgi:hypothetical protein